MEIRRVRPDPNAAGIKDDDLISQEILKRRAIQEAQSNDYPVYDSTKEVASPSELMQDQLEALAPKKYEINPDLANYLTQMRAGKDEAAAQERKQNALFQAFDAVGQARANEWGSKYSPIGDTGDSAQKAAMAAEGEVNKAQLKDIEGHINRRGEIARALASKRDGSNLSRTFLKESQYVTDQGKPVLVYNDPNTGISKYFDSNNNPISEDRMISKTEYGMLKGQKIEQEKNIREKAAKLGEDLSGYSAGGTTFEDIERTLSEQSGGKIKSLDDFQMGEGNIFTGPTIENKKGESVDLPGVNIFGFGRKDFTRSGQSSALQSDIKKLIQSYQKAISGLTVSEAEGKRIAQALEQGEYTSEGEMLRGLRDLKEILRRDKEAKLNQYGPEARAKYLEDQAKIPSVPLPSLPITTPENVQTPQVPPAKPKTVKQNGKTFILNEETGKYERQK